MSFDALTLSAVRDELEPLLTDGRVQKLVYPDELSLAAEIYSPGSGRTDVLVSAHPETGRVQRIRGLPARGVERDTPFLLVVRKYLRSARVRAVRQPRLERVFELHCEQREAAAEQRVKLIVEAMGRRGNLVLVSDAGIILDAARRSPPSRNPRRPVLPHLPYESPPPQNRLLPEQLTPEALAVAAGDPQALLARFLSDRLAGLSPLAGRELAFRATGSIDTLIGEVDWDVIVRAAMAFYEPLDSHAWEPTVASRDEHPQAFAPYALTHLAASGATLERFSAISAALDNYYSRLQSAGPAAHTGDPLLAERRALLVPLERTARSLERRLAALQTQLDGGHSQREPLQRAGELLLAYQTQVEPGASVLELEGESIELDPHLTAVENAQAYFARYRKAREAEARVPELLEEARHQATHISELRTLVELADGMDAVRALRREVASATAGGSKSSTVQPTRSAPYRRVSLPDGFEALVGASAQGNAAVTFDRAQAEDLWLHARGVPGAHVILRGTSPTPSAVERAAQLAAWHSSARASSSVEVDVTTRRYVKKIPNAPPGLVRYSNERTIRVNPVQ